VEIEASSIANLVDKMETGELNPCPIFTDVKTFPYRRFRGLVDILTGGFPCQPFSFAGLQQGVEDPRHLFPYILQGIVECEPTVVLLENVEGIISAKTADGESVLQYVIRSLEEVGYRATAGIFSAEEVGAPHQRKRVFILAHRINTRLEGGIHWWENPQRENLNGHSGCGSASIHDRWPSRPGEDQHEWEAPRTTPVGDTNREGPQVRSGEEGENIQGANSNGGKAKRRTTKPRLGGTSDGVASRVDRLRMLGNGVVPAVATKAFVCLTQRLIEQKELEESLT
jgi:DNA (cytosine-5)-methyltransferase 1